MLEDDPNGYRGDPWSIGRTPVSLTLYYVTYTVGEAEMLVLIKYVSAIILIVGTILPEYSTAGANNAPMIARWYGAKQAAVSLRFDDSLESHVKYAIPLLNKYDIKATFMINPGLERFAKNKYFWENQVPLMGHQLGNHTMHHRGAKTPAEADFEIGEVSRLIWRIYPEQSKLLVFASGGGGKKWGGKYWEEAPEDYKSLVRKYFLIDLYDGQHPHLSVQSELSDEEIIRFIRKALRENRHQAIVFHEIGRPGILERLKGIYRGYDLSINHESLENILVFLQKMEKVLWTAPVADILKYEKERNGAQLVLTSRDKSHIRIDLIVNTDSKFYDHNLTVVVPADDKFKVNSIVQGTKRIELYSQSENRITFNIQPVNSQITLSFH